jgi:hypothetical protein
MDDIFEGVVGIVIFAMIITAAIMGAMVVGMILLPIGLVGAGGLYYVNNIHLPEKRRRETRLRVENMHARASQVSPVKQRLIDALIAAGVVSQRLHGIAMELYRDEGLTPPALPPLSDDPIANAKYEDQLQKFMSAARPDHYQDFEHELVDALRDYEPDDNPTGKMFLSTREFSRKEVEKLMLRFANDDGIFPKLNAQLNDNWHAEDEAYPTACKHDDYVWRYLKNTPLLPLADVNEWIGIESRMYHTYLLGSSGSGKTNLIENIIANDLTGDEDCCVVVIDSQTQLTEKLAALDVPDTTYITPKFNLALNLFDVGYEDMKGRGIEGETLINKTVGLLSFVMEGMMGTAFTSPQKTIFQYAIQLVISIKGGNIFTFMEILSDGGHVRYQSDIDQFDDNTRRFFDVDFGSNEYKRSREAIRRRLDSLLMNPTFRRLFSATENNIDMLEQLETQRLILIDTNKPMLDDDASAFFGRLFIAMILRASHMRFAGGRQMRPVYLIVDEAHEYFDRSISDMLEQARKANIGMIVAHQSLSQAKGRDGGGNIADPLMVNTATKIIWTAYKEDATKFAGSMQIDAKDILNLPQFTFGMHSRKRGFTPIRGIPNAFADIAKRESRTELQQRMERLYGRYTDEPKAAKRPWPDENDMARPDQAEDTFTPQQANGVDRSNKLPPNPDDDMI